MSTKTWRRTCAAALVCLTLSACHKDLYTSISEADANQLLVVLMRAGVEAEKASRDGGKTWAVTVPEDRVVQSLELLRAHGLPQGRFANLGEMFKKDGLVSTPVEERVRFIYGTSQELSDTLSRMDGVVAARVHIVMPNNDPLATESKPSSASVFVKYRTGTPVESLAGPVKNLVAHSVEGLHYDAVSVTFVPSDPAPEAGAYARTTLSVLLPWATAVLAIGGLVGAGLAWWRWAARAGRVPPWKSRRSSDRSPLDTGA